MHNYSIYLIHCRPTFQITDYCDVLFYNLVLREMCTMRFVGLHRPVLMAVTGNYYVTEYIYMNVCTGIFERGASCKFNYFRKLQFHTLTSYSYMTELN